MGAGNFKASRSQEPISSCDNSCSNPFLPSKALQHPCPVTAGEGGPVSLKINQTVLEAQIQGTNVLCHEGCDTSDARLDGILRT